MLSINKRVLLMMILASAFISVALEVQGALVNGPDPFADKVYSVSYGARAGFGQGNYPDVVLGPPKGEGAYLGSLDVLSLGNKGEIILEFTDNYIYDGPGTDFTIFENPFLAIKSNDNCWTEVARVAVSDNGATFVEFPFYYDPDGPGGSGGLVYKNPVNFRGFAGVNPVLSNPSNGVNPTDPSVSGGDFFDLADITTEAESLGVNLDTIRFIKITDIYDSAYDYDGHLVDDAGNHYSGNGFDLDAIAGVHTVLIPEPLTLLLLGSGLIGLLGYRRKNIEVATVKGNSQCC